MRLENRRAAVHGFTEYGLGFINFTAHVRVLGTLAWKQETHRWILDRTKAGLHALAIASRERGNRLLHISGDYRAAAREGSPPRLQRPCRIRQFRVRSGLEEFNEIVGRSIKRGRRSCGNDQELERALRSLGNPRGGLLEDHVRVRSTYAECAHPCSPRYSIRFPFLSLDVHIERAVFEIEVRIRRGKMERWRKYPVAHDVGCVDQTGYAGGDIQVAHVYLSCAYGAETLL